MQLLERRSRRGGERTRRDAGTSGAPTPTLQLLAMQKVEGSNPFSRSPEVLHLQAVFMRAIGSCVCLVPDRNRTVAGPRGGDTGDREPDPTDDALVGEDPASEQDIAQGQGDGPLPARGLVPVSPSASTEPGWREGVPARPGRGGGRPRSRAGRASSAGGARGPRWCVRSDRGASRCRCS
jgi:hypothetical protein